MNNSTKLSTFWAIVLFMSFFNYSSAQKTFDDEGTVKEYNAPYESITLMVEDDETDYTITQATEFPKKINKEDIKIGQKVKIQFIIEKRVRIATEIKVISDKIEDTNKFTGVFEYVEGDIAFVDGRKVKLTETAMIECPRSGMFKKDCGCDRNKAYTGFDDKGIKKGAFFTVKGKMGQDGIIQSTHVTVCKNLKTDDEIELRRIVEQSYNAKGLAMVKAPTGFNTNYPLHQGNIKMGNLEYKLYDSIKVQGYINMVGNRIIPEYARDSQYLKLNEIYWRFYVIDNEIPNAFAYPNGMVFIHTGLLKLIDNEAQLALVLGHEVAHVLYEHSVSRYKKSKLLGSDIAKTGVDVVKGEVRKWLPNSNPVLSAKGLNLDNLAGNLLDKFSPEQLSGLHEKDKETQADRVGLAYIYLMGYDLREAPKFWLKMKEITKNETFMQKMKGDALNFFQTNKLNFNQNILQQLTSQSLDMVTNNLLENIYASHPLAKTRYDDINKLISTHYKDVDFSKTLIGVEEYNMYLSVLKN
jgi:beta-barrel assembly-enhancing protease